MYSHIVSNSPKSVYLLRVRVQNFSCSTITSGNLSQISAQPALRACSYGQKLSRLPTKHFDKSNTFILFLWEMFSRLPGKVSRCDVDFVKCKHKVFPLSGKVVFIWDGNDLGDRDLACQPAKSRYPSVSQ